MTTKQIINNYRWWAWLLSISAVAMFDTYKYGSFVLWSFLIIISVDTINDLITAHNKEQEEKIKKLLTSLNK